MKNDLISRKQAIDACMKYNGYGSVWACIMGDIKQLPSVTIKDTDDKIKVTNCHHIAEDSMKSDLISKKAVLDILNKCFAEIELDYGRPVNCYEGMFYTRLKMALSTARPEPAKEEQKDGD